MFQTRRHPSTPIKLVDRNYTPPSSFVGRNFSIIGSSSRLTIPAADHLAADIIDLPITISSNKNFIGRRTQLDIQGTATGPQIFGQWLNIATNSLFLSGTSRMYGLYSTVDAGAPFTEVFGGYFGASSGGSGANGLGLLTGVRIAVGTAHNGDTTTAIGLDSWMTGSSSSPSNVTGVTTGLKSRATLQSGVNWNDWRGLWVGDIVDNTGTIIKSYGIYLDATIDKGSSEKWAFYSLSTSPSLFTGDIIQPLKTPASATATALQAGLIRWDANFIYISTGVNTWKRVAIATW